MAGNTEHNADLLIDGKLMVDVVPNATGTTILVYDSASKEIRGRNHTNFISELSLATTQYVNSQGFITTAALGGLVPYSGATQNLDMGVHHIYGARVHTNSHYSPLLPGSQVIEASATGMSIGNPNVPGMWFETADTNLIHYRAGYGNAKIWDEHNDGPDSGLHADLLDGQHGAHYLSWNNFTGVPATFPPTAHNHDDRYYTETESNTKFVPYTGAIANLNLGNYNLFSKNIKTTGTIFNGLYSPIVIEGHEPFDRNSILLKVPFQGMGGFKVKIWSYYVGTTGKQFFEFFISNYRYNNGYHFPEVTWVAGDSNRIQKIEFLKDTNGLYFINIVVTTSYPRVAITDCMMADSFPATITEKENWGITFNTPVTGLIKEYEKVPSQFLRDNFILTSTVDKIVSNSTYTGLQNGTNKNFILPGNFVANSTRVYLNGIRQRIGVGNDYTESGQNTIIFADPPDINDNIVIDYIKQ